MIGLERRHMNEETLAKALWDIVPYARAYGWDEHPNEEVRSHYRDRARKLLDQFLIYERYDV